MAQTQVQNVIQNQENNQTEEQKLKREAQQRQKQQKRWLAERQRKRIQKQRSEDIKCIDPEYQFYFRNNLSNENSLHLINSMFKQISKQVKRDIKHGTIIIPHESRSIDEYLQRSKGHGDSEKTNNALIKKLKLQSELNQLETQLKRYQKYELNHQNKDVNRLNKSRINTGKELTAQQMQEHKKFMEKIIKLRNQMDQKRRQYVIEQQNKIKQIQLAEEQDKKLKFLQQKQRKMQKISDHMKQIELRRQASKVEMKEARVRIKSVIHRKKKYEQMQEAYYQKFVLPSIQEKKKILSDRRKFLNSYNVQNIKEYEIKYLKMKQEMETNGKNKSIEQWTYKPPPCSQRLLRILQQQKIQQKVKVEQKQRMLEDKKSRQESYKQYLKQKVALMINQNKSKTSTNKIEKVEKNIVEVQSKAGKALGNRYLEQLRSLPKKEKAESEKPAKNSFIPPPSPEEANKTQKSSPKNFITSSKSTMTFCQKNNKKVQKILSSNALNNQQKIKQLKKQIQKLSEYSKRREQLNKTLNNKPQQEQELQFLLSSIKAKVMIMQLYNK